MVSIPRRSERPLRKNVRTGSVGLEIVSAVTLLLLALAKVIDPGTTASSIVVFLLSLQFPGVWLSLVFVLGLLHLYALDKKSVRPWTGIRKACSAVGAGVYVAIIADVLHVRPNIGAVVWLGLIAVFLLVACFRFNYGT